MNIKIYDKRPDDFAAKIEVAAIYVNVENKILLLQIADHKDEKRTWGVPAGKLERNESPQEAAKRELFEETGISIESINLFKPLGALYIRKPTLDYVYHLFGVKLSKKPRLALSSEHCSYLWVSQEEAQALPLMSGAQEALDAYFVKVK